MLSTVLVIFVASLVSRILGDDVRTFLDLAREATSPHISDKVQSHAYHEIYGRILLPHIREIHGLGRGYKFLEIGAGCAIPEKLKGLQVWDRLFNKKTILSG